MEKTKIKKIITGSLILSVIAFIIYKVFQISNENPKVKDIKTGDTPNTGTSTGNDVVDPARVLKIGDHGQSVFELQNNVNDLIDAYMMHGPYHEPLVPDKTYGPATDAAIKFVSNGVLSSSKGNVTINAVKALKPVVATGNTTPSGGINWSNLYSDEMGGRKKTDCNCGH